MGDAVPKKWTSLEEAKHPKFKKTSLIKAHLGTLKRVFDKPLHYKAFGSFLTVFPSVFGLTLTIVFIDEVLAATSKSVEPKEVPFSTMSGDRVPLFHRAKVMKKSAEGSGAPMEKDVPSAAATTSTSTAEKRLVPTEARPRLFLKRQKHIAQRPKRFDTLTISDELPSFSPYSNQKTPVRLSAIILHPSPFH
ncbi:hypothetical protein LIER_41931 [Lithospermum erythrorhizon]|uniref:Uncharacterized protein n=1 Tax=Lithospermum erythrorhizon TaxID=34254 RepID=A0AAV3RJZ5_LITER